MKNQRCRKICHALRGDFKPPHLFNYFQTTLSSFLCNVYCWLSVDRRDAATPSKTKTITLRSASTMIRIHDAVHDARRRFHTAAQKCTRNNAPMSTKCQISNVQCPRTTSGRKRGHSRHWHSSRGRHRDRQRRNGPP